MRWLSAFKYRWLIRLSGENLTESKFGTLITMSSCAVSCFVPATDLLTILYNNIMQLFSHSETTFMPVRHLLIWAVVVTCWSGVMCILMPLDVIHRTEKQGEATLAKECSFYSTTYFLWLWRKLCNLHVLINVSWGSLLYWICYNMVVGKTFHCI